MEGRRSGKGRESGLLTNKLPQPSYMEVSTKWAETISIASDTDSQIDFRTIAEMADYVGQNYKCGGITRGEVESQTKSVITVAPRPALDAVTGLANPLDIVEWTNKRKITDFQVQCQTDNTHKVFSLVWQQCTEAC